MKRTLLGMILLLSLICCTAAAGDPAVTDGETTAWIADGGSLYIQNSETVIRQVPMTAVDLLGLTQDELIFLSKPGQIMAVQRDGNGFRNGTSADIPGEQPAKLENGILSVDGSPVSETACAFTTDGDLLYYVEKGDWFWTLKVQPLREGEASAETDSRAAFAGSFSGSPVSEPLNLTVTRDALTLTGTDHRVTVMSLLDGTVTTFPASGEQTSAACMINHVLYRYTVSEDGQWTPEASEIITVQETAGPAVTPDADAAPTATPEPTATPTAVPTPTATPSPTPTATPSPTPTATTKPTATPDDLIDDDGTIHKGASGSEVRKVQKRLSELGYPTGKVDGKYGDQTQIAINLFCNAIQVRQHSYISPKVQKRLFSDSAPAYDPYLPLKKGDEGQSVLFMQRRLKELGYDPGKLDGIYGKMTVDAVARFQTDYEIKLSTGETLGENASRDMLQILFAPQDDMVRSKSDS